MTVEERIAENSKNKAIEEVTGFSKKQPVGFETDSILDAGDVIVMPATMPKVFKQVFGQNEDGEDIYAEFIVVNVEHPGKATRAINFFPSSLTKNIWPAEKDDDGDVVLVGNGPLNPKGTAVDLFKSFQGQTGSSGETDTQLGVNALLNKRIAIPSKEMIDTQVFRKGKRINELRKTGLLTYNVQ